MAGSGRWSVTESICGSCDDSVMVHAGHRQLLQAALHATTAGLHLPAAALAGLSWTAAPTGWLPYQRDALMTRRATCFATTMVGIMHLGGRLAAIVNILQASAESYHNQTRLLTKHRRLKRLHDCSLHL